jgi:hypothetical protein
MIKWIGSGRYFYDCFCDKRVYIDAGFPQHTAAGARTSVDTRSLIFGQLQDQTVME